MSAKITTICLKLPITQKLQDPGSVTARESPLEAKIMNYKKSLRIRNLDLRLLSLTKITTTTRTRVANNSKPLRSSTRLRDRTKAMAATTTTKETEELRMK